MEQKQEVLTIDLRRCGQCGAREMRPEKIEWEGMGNQQNYICPACHHTKSIKPAGGAASLISMALIVLAVPTAMMIDGYVRDWFSWAVLGAAATLALWAPILTLIENFRYRVTGQDERVVEVDVLSDPLQKGIARTEGVGILKGFLSPILLFATVMLIAGIIGFVFNP